MNTSEPIPSISGTSAGSRSALATRIGLLIGALFIEKFLLNSFVDTAKADAARGVGASIRALQHVGFRFAVPFSFALAVLALMPGDAGLTRIAAEARDARLRPRWLALHIALLVSLAASLTRWYGQAGIRIPLVGLSTCLSAAALVTLLCGLAPLNLWHRLSAALGIRWLYAAATAAASSAVFSLSQHLWAGTAQATFELVKVALAPVLPSLVADSTTRILRTNHFAVYVAPYCSGLEGMGLMLVFSSAWLLYFRKEYRFPRALLLIPAGLALIFALNALRIAALILLGNAGLATIAMYGFHSQAGWIAFNLAACAIAVTTRSSKWFSRAQEFESAAKTPRANATAAYLVPFLAALLAGMISRAFSSGFESAYALRFIAAAIALAFFWRRLKGLNWGFSWLGVCTGVGVFGLWFAASALVVTPHAIPAPLAAMSVARRDLWIASAMATRICAIPVVEELAYRGYLMRRVVADDFEAVSFQSLRCTPLLVAALAFSVIYGELWLPAIAAGMMYGLVTIRTGRIGEAIAAHTTCNLLIALCVLAAGQWQFW